MIAVLEFTMVRKILISPIILLILFLTYAVNSDNNYSTVIDNLTIPWAIDFLPDSTMIFTERTGSVKIKKNDSVKVIKTINVAHTGEAGLLGIAVDPDFNQNRFVYVYYTYKNNGLTNRVSRFYYSDSLLNEHILIDNIPGAKFHDGGRVKFGPDQLLYITTGDALKPENAGDINSLSGKILRIEKNGAVPKDNPFNNYTYASGLRNPQGLAWDNDTLYASDHGPVKRDEINRIEKGKDYGWPRTCDAYPAFKCYPYFTIAPSGIAIVNKNLFIACLRGAQLRKINLIDGHEEVVLNDPGRLREVVFKYKSLFISTSNKDGRGKPKKGDDRIIRYEIDK